MRIAYIAGPYRSKTISGIRANIEHARKYAEKYWRAGFAVICPHLNSALMDGIVPDKSFLEGDIAILERCDFIVMVPGWTESKGAKNELEAARAAGLDIVYE